MRRRRTRIEDVWRNPLQHGWVERVSPDLRLERAPG